LHETNKTGIQPKLSDSNIELNSFIILNTPYNQLTRWKYQESMAGFNLNHVLFQKEQRQNYLQIIIDKQKT
jgi:hypothetical protein